MSVFNVTNLWYKLTKFANGYLHYAKHDKLMKLIYVLLIVLDPVPVTGNLVWQTRVPVAGTPESRDWSGVPVTGTGVTPVPVTGTGVTAVPAAKTRVHYRHR